VDFKLNYFVKLFSRGSHRQLLYKKKYNNYRYFSLTISYYRYYRCLCVLPQVVQKKHNNYSYFPYGSRRQLNI